MEKTRNYASEPKKCARKRQSELKYEDAGSDERPDLNNILSERAVVSGEVFPIGVGHTEKKAKQNAAKHTLRGLSEKENQRPVEQNPVVKPKRRFETHFEDACQISSQDEMIPEGASTGNSEMSLSQSNTPCLTSDFDFMELLGRGGFGRVYQVEHKSTKMEFAIKIVRFKENTKPLREVKALSDLRHDHIVQYYTCWEDDNEYQGDSVPDSWSSSQSSSTDLSVKFLYIQMELCHTETLKDWIDEKNYNNFLQDSKRRDESLSFAKQIVSGVKYIHSKYLIHRDLKPANIMFGKENRKVKIGDFGLVIAENDDDAENLVEMMASEGTPSYMAPEQKNQETYDRKVDIYAVGLIYFELIWKISTVHEKQEIWGDVRRQKFPQGFSDIFPQEYMIIKPMLCVKPEDRPEASELMTQLEE